MPPGCEDMKHFQPSKSEDRIILLNLEVSDRKCKKMKMEKSTKKIILLNIKEHLGMIAGVICGSLGLLSLLFAVLLCRRYNQVTRYLVRRFVCCNSFGLSGWTVCCKNSSLVCLSVGESQKFCFPQVIQICLMAFFIRGSPEFLFEQI